MGHYLIDFMFRITFSIIIFYLFEVIQSRQLGLAYMYSAILVLCWYMSQLFKQTADYLSYLLSSHLKAGFAMLLYTKISKITSYVVKSSELGKITNLISNDLSVIEMRLHSLLVSAVFPAAIVGITILLVIRIGWISIIGIIIMLIEVPIANRISKKNGEIVVEANKFKDKRVQITTELIEGIKYVKIYGWELAFKKIIHGIREQEIGELKSLAFGRAFERAMAHGTSFLTSLIIFIFADIMDSNKLNYALIFSTLEIFSSVRRNLTWLNIGVGLYF